MLSRYNIFMVEVYLIMLLRFDDFFLKCVECCFDGIRIYNYLWIYIYI